MTRSIARWTTALIAAAVIALPTAAFSQSSTPPQTPPAQPTEPQTTQPPQMAQPAAGEEVAKQHLTAARNALSELTQLPAATQLTGDARTHVSQLISSFNELITTKEDWRASYTKVENSLTALIGAQTTDESAAATTGTAGAVGTAGTVTLDPAIRAKLIEFRGHLEKFEKSAGGAAPSTPAEPTPAGPPAGTPASGAPTTAGAAPASPQAASSQMNQEEILRHVAAIEAILAVQTTGATGATAGTAGTGAASTGALTLTTSQIEQLRTHLSELRRLAGSRDK